MQQQRSDVLVRRGHSCVYSTSGQCWACPGSGHLLVHDISLSKLPVGLAHQVLRQLLRTSPDETLILDARTQSACNHYRK